MPSHPFTVTHSSFRRLLRFMTVAQCALAGSPTLAADNHACPPSTEIAVYDAATGTASADPYAFYVFNREKPARTDQNAACAATLKPDQPQADPQKADNLIALDAPAFAQQRRLTRVE